MSLDISSFEAAITRLEEGLARYQADITDTQIRDGLIQRFEFTYELAHKTVKRYLDFVAPSPGLYQEMAFPDLIRSANEQGLLRGKTSHAYGEKTALGVVSGIPGFLTEVRFLRDELRRRLG